MMIRRLIDERFIGILNSVFTKSNIPSNQGRSRDVQNERVHNAVCSVQIELERRSRTARM